MIINNDIEVTEMNDVYYIGIFETETRLLGGFRAEEDKIGFLYEIRLEKVANIIKAPKMECLTFDVEAYYSWMERRKLCQITFEKELPKYLVIPTAFHLIQKELSFGNEVLRKLGNALGKEEENTILNLEIE